MSATTTTRAKLPVFKTVGRAYRAAFGNLGTFIRISWLWLLLIIVVGLVFNALTPARLIPSDPAAYARFDATDWMLVSVIGLVNKLAFLPMLSSIAVNWHRLLLRGEQPGPTAFMRLDAPVWAYVALAAMIAVAQVLFSLPQSFATINILGTRTPTAAASLLLIATNLVFLAALMFMARYSVALPAKALEVPGIGFSEAFAATRRNTWRLSLGFTLCFLPLIVFGVLAVTVWPGQAAVLGTGQIAIAFRVVGGVLGVLMGIIGVGFLSYAFEHFFLAPAHGTGV